jgi:OFA family oxalate/formate antiporter-like MFS transporter
MRGRLAAAGVAMQAGLGTAYAWSAFRNPLAERFGWSLSEVSLTFSIMILTAGFGAFLGGLWLKRVGPRRVAMVSGALYGAGVSLAGVFGGDLVVLYVTYGLVAGAGLGLGYIVPIATLVRWFPDRRGFITGLAVSGFAAGALAATPIAARLVASLGPLDALTVLGAVELVVVAGAGSFLREPAVAGGSPGGRWRQPASRGVGPDLTLHQALRTWRWYALWVIFFLSVAAGVGFIAEAVPMAQELAGMEALAAAGLIGTAFVTDALGRFLCPWASDALGRRTVLVAIFMLQSGAFAALTLARSPLAFGVLAALVVFLYGGSSGTMPAFVADVFGGRHVGSIYGLILTAWGFGGVLGPVLLATVRQSTGAYDSGLAAIACLMLAGAVLPALVRAARPAA